jgi:hypothetical protein
VLVTLSVSNSQQGRDLVAIQSSEIMLTEPFLVDTVVTLKK